MRRSCDLCVGVTKMKKKMDVEGNGVKGAIDVSRNRYPYSIVWTPLPIITYDHYIMLLNPPTSVILIV